MLQVWSFILECIKRAQMHEEEVISFLCMLSYCQVGKCYPLQALSPIQKQLVVEFTNVKYICNIA
jgi:hypothetical protein